MAESKHALCRRIQCDLVDFEREIAFRTMERDAVERRLTPFRERLTVLNFKKRGLEAMGNVKSPPPARVTPQNLVKELTFGIWLELEKELTEQELVDVTGALAANQQIFDQLEERLRQLRANQKISLDKWTEQRCGRNYLPSAATPESCGLPPLRPMDTIGDRDLHFG